MEQYHLLPFGFVASPAKRGDKSFAQELPSFQLECEGGSGHCRPEGADQLPAIDWQAIVEKADETTHTVAPSSRTRFCRITELPPPPESDDANPQRHGPRIYGASKKSLPRT